MKQTLEGVLKYLRKNYCSYWIILGIDTAIAVLCTWIAYIGIYSMREFLYEQMFLRKL